MPGVSDTGCQYSHRIVIIVSVDVMYLGVICVDNTYHFYYHPKGEEIIIINVKYLRYKQNSFVVVRALSSRYLRCLSL